MTFHTPTPYLHCLLAHTCGSNASKCRFCRWLCRWLLLALYCQPSAPLQCTYTSRQHLLDSYSYSAVPCSQCRVRCGCWWRWRWRWRLWQVPFILLFLSLVCLWYPCLWYRNTTERPRSYFSFFGLNLCNDHCDEQDIGHAQLKTTLLFVDDHDVLYTAGTQRVLHPLKRNTPGALPSVPPSSATLLLARDCAPSGTPLHHRRGSAPGLLC